MVCKRGALCIYCPGMRTSATLHATSTRTFCPSGTSSNISARTSTCLLNPPRQVTFVLVVDACRVAEMDQATLSSSLEPPPGSAPVTWALCFSCSRLDGVGRPAGGTQPICTGAPRRESGHLCSGRATQGGPGGGGSADEREAPGSGSDAGGIAQYPGGLVLLYFPG